MLKLHVADFLNHRRELADQLRKVKKLWAEARADFADIEVSEERVHYLITKHRTREVNRIMADVQKNYRHAFWVTKPTLPNLIKLREQYRAAAQRQAEYIETQSYVMDDGYSLCGKSDHDWDTLQDLKHRVLELTSLIVRIKKGLEPRL